MTDAVLASWNDGPARQAIVDFVTSATDGGMYTRSPCASRSPSLVREMHKAVASPAC